MREVIHKAHKWSAANFKVITIITLIVVMIVASSYILYRPKTCTSPECFLDSMQSCSKATYINEEPEASWRYQIEGTSNGQCKINVKLLLAKKGELGIEKLTGLEMNCFYTKGFSAYPEKDLGKCTGKLKEELQTIIINKLHSYIIENLGQIKEELTQATS